MSLYNIDGKITVDDIVKDSPAFKAGLRKDDIVMAINNNFSNDITVYKNLLQAERGYVKVLIYRQNVPHIINLKVGKIY
jgi:C-terminal processing protease CtpA/Prc